MVIYFLVNNPLLGEAAKGFFGQLGVGCAEQWEKFTEQLKDTAVTHMYASEHHFRCVHLSRGLRCPRCGNSIGIDHFNDQYRLIYLIEAR